MKIITIIEKTWLEYNNIDLEVKINMAEERGVKYK